MMVQLIKSSLRFNYTRSIAQRRAFCNSSFLKSDKVPDEVIPKNLLEDSIIEHLQPNGQMYDGKPFRLKLQAGRKYAWCTCGQSKSQPLCDGTHKIEPLRIKLKPIPFKVAESKEYWLCNCKQSLHRPFCDGTHKKLNLRESPKNLKGSEGQ